MDVFDEGWRVMEQGIAKLKALTAGETKSQFTSEEYMLLYSIVFDLCQQSTVFSRLLHEKHRQTFEDHLSLTVLPSLQEKHGAILLRDFAASWSGLKLMAHWMARFFQYLDRVYVGYRGLTPLYEVAITCFRDLLYSTIKGKVLDAVLFLIDREREGHEGHEVDRVLLKNAVDVFVEIGMGNMEHYVKDFEAPMLERTSTYYSRKASKSQSKVDEYLKDEKDRASHYLLPRSETKLLETARHELLVVRTAQLHL